MNGMIWQLKERFISQTQKEALQDLTTEIPVTSVMMKDIPVSEIPRSEPEVNDHR